jgi:hypothetical protein
MSWEGAQVIERPSGRWELLGEEKRAAELERGPVWHVYFRRIGRSRIHSGAIEVTPLTAAHDELAPQLASVKQSNEERYG